MRAVNSIDWHTRRDKQNDVDRKKRALHSFTYFDTLFSISLVPNYFPLSLRYIAETGIRMGMHKHRLRP